MTKRIMAKVETYEKDGQTKGKYVEVGVILSNQNGEYALLDPTVNLSGVLQKQNMLNSKAGQPMRDMVMVSIFEQQPQQPQQQPQQQQQQPKIQQQQSDFNSDIPF